MKLTFSLGLVLIATAGLIPAADTKIAPDLMRQAEGNADVIVQYSVAPTASHHEKVLRRGGVLKADLSGIIKAAAYSIPTSALADLADDPDVVYIAPDRPLKGMLNYTAAAVNASVAWTQYRAIIDLANQAEPAKLENGVTGRAVNRLSSRPASFPVCA